LVVAGCGGKAIEYLDGSASSDGQNPPPSHPFNCSVQSPCPNDPPSSQSSIDLCNQMLQGPCGAPYQTAGDCIVTNFKCTTAGTLDANAILAACQAQLNAYQQCIMPPGDGGPVEF
jgi:hypothetical protein